jgi:membrane protein
MSLKERIEKVRQFVLRQQWAYDLADIRRSRKLLQKTSRVLTLALYEYATSKCGLRAAALTLVFVFSLAPALALGFSVAKGFGVQEKIRPVIYQWLGVADAPEPAPGQDGGQATESVTTVEVQPIRKVLDTILGYVENTDANALGVLGLLIILYAAYKVLNAIEATMNEIWGIRKSRSLVRKIIDYLAVLFVLPLMLVIATLILTLFKSQTAMTFINTLLPGPLIGVMGAATAIGASAVGFWFLYFFFPNTRVPVLSAVAGALVAAVLWSFSQYMYVQLQVGVAKYNAIYGTFAAIPIFLLWLYVSWSVILFGAEVSYAHASQSEFEYGGLMFAPSAAYRSRLALGVMLLAARAFQDEKPGPTVGDCSRALAAPIRTVRNVIADLMNARVLAEVASESMPAYAPAAPLQQITLGRILDAVNEAGETPSHSIRALEKAGVNSLFDESLKGSRDFRQVTIEDALSGKNGLPGNSRRK